MKERSPEIQSQMMKDPLLGDKQERTTIYTPRNHEGVIEKGSSILLLGEIDEKVTELMCSSLEYMEQSPDIEEINIHIHSQGGMLVDIMPIVNKMLEITKPIKTVAIGKAFSGAAFILAAGTPERRFSYPDAHILLHQCQMSDGIHGSYEDIKQGWIQLAKINNRYLTLLSEFTGQPKQKLREDLKTDKYFTPKEAKDYGIIDRIIKRGKRYVQIREENGFE